MNTYGRDQKRLYSFGLFNPLLNKQDLNRLKENMEGETNMAEKEFKPRTPDLKGDGVAIWKETDKNGNEYASVVILGGKAIRCWKPKEKKEE